MEVVVGGGAAVGVGEAGLGDGAAVELEVGDDESEVPLGPPPVPQAARAAPRRKPIAVVALTADLILRTVRRDESGESCTGSASVSCASAKPGPQPCSSERTEHTGLAQCWGITSMKGSSLSRGSWAFGRRSGRWTVVVGRGDHGVRSGDQTTHLFGGVPMVGMRTGRLNHYEQPPDGRGLCDSRARLTRFDEQLMLRPAGTPRILLGRATRRSRDRAGGAPGPAGRS